MSVYVKKITLPELIKRAQAFNNYRIKVRKNRKKGRKLTYDNTYAIINLFIKELGNILERGHRVQIRGLGTFWVKEARQMFLPHRDFGGERTMRTVGRRVKFRMSEKLFRRFNRPKTVLDPRIL